VAVNQVVGVNVMVRQVGVEIDKGRLIKSLEAQRVLLEVTIEQLAPELMELPNVEGAWSVKGVLAHIAAWDVRGTSWIEAAARGETPEFPEPGNTWADLDLINARLYAEQHDQSLGQVLKMFETTYPPLLAAAKAFPDDQITRPITFFNGIETQTIPAGRLIQWRYRHYHTHGAKIREWLKAYQGQSENRH
jgi:hypothetical protein